MVEISEREEKQEFNTPSSEKYIKCTTTSIPTGRFREVNGVEKFQIYCWTCAVEESLVPTLRHKPLIGNLSEFVESVTFDLHDSFNDPQRIVTSPPFLIEEEGYGSFDIQITLKFKDPNINSFHFLHRLVVTKPKSSDLLTINLNSGFGNCIEMLYGYDVDLLERKLNLLGGRDILHAAQIVKDMRDDGCWVDESIEGEFHFDLYSLRKEIIDTLWNFVKNK